MKNLASRKLFIKTRPKKPAKMLLFATEMFLFCGSELRDREAGIIYLKTKPTLELERQKIKTKRRFPLESQTSHLI